MRNIIQTTFRPLKNQSGAMFGMDARVALIIASVLAAAGATSVMSKLERNRVEQAELGVQILRDAIESHYRTIGIHSLTRDIDTLFREGFVEDNSQITDPWGLDWEYNISKRELRIEDVPITIHLATLHSSGKDGIDDSPSMVNPVDWDTWAPGNDDIGVKLSTIEIEKERVAEYRNRGKLIVDKLHGVESSNYLEADNFCSVDTPPEWCDRKNKPNTTTFNFYPPSSMDNSGASYYSETKQGEKVYLSGNLDSMEELMDDLGLPRDFSKDPWGKILCYHSNIDQERPVPDRPPFTASIWFAEDGLCQ